VSEQDGARDRMIGAIRTALGARGDEPGRRGAVRARLERNPHGLKPERALTVRDDLPDQMAANLKTLGVVVRILEDPGELPRAIAGQLAAFNLPARVRHGADPILGGIDWDGTSVEAVTGPAQAEDAVSLSRAKFGAAETGTLILTSGVDNPSTLNFLPEAHFVVLGARDIVGSYEEVWDRLRAEHGRGQLPRTVNFVTGASATADIEQTLIKGAHGPKRLAVFLLLDGEA
jgi:L-lactate dehydrogenase complex protein LldG